MSAQSLIHHPRLKKNVCGSDMFICTWTTQYSLNKMAKMLWKFIKTFWKRSRTIILLSAKFGSHWLCTICARAIWIKHAKHLGRRLADVLVLRFSRLTLTLKCNYLNWTDVELFSSGNWQFSRNWLPHGFRLLSLKLRLKNLIEHEVFTVLGVSRI